MTDKYAIRKSIKHWKDMIEWTKKQDQKKRCDVNKMLNEIGQSTGSVSCALCIEFVNCVYCPLSKRYGNCFCGDENAYTPFDSRFSVGEWIVKAKKMVEQLKSLL